MTEALTFTPEISGVKRAAIMNQLEAIQAEENVRILFAIESGSRAWGFPSPDSDYDVRFVYVHDEDWYLSIQPGRDVIEKPLVDDWDVNGWDLKKAIGLLLKPNPVLLEWMCSPVQYIWNESAVSKLQAFAARHVSPRTCTGHYYHLGKGMWDRNIFAHDQIKLKKYFYVLRPALALRWVRMRPERLPPMNFQKLAQGTELSAEVLENIADLMRKKSVSSEAKLGGRIPVLDELIEDEFERAERAGFSKLVLTDEIRAEADTLFRQLVREGGFHD
ncbi:nucleotidyltransferase domain-containing protein [Ponticaulis profundi]|uniref:Nucleotidyltransferase domain-containing protein n=1 Tax=Ponticaulis profundi TaxID=2665222 RepID=A0ABW1S5L1_9PROT